MDSHELAFAGAAQQARMLADGAITAPALLDVYLERIGRLDPELRSYRVVLADTAREEAAAAQARLDAGERLPLLGVPIAIKDDVDVAGEVTTYGTAAHGPARSRGRRGGAAAARGGRGHHRQDRGARDDGLVVHRNADVRGDAQSVEHRLHAGRQQRRQWCGGGRGSGADGARIRRHGFDPDSVDVVRAVRDQAAAGPGAAGAARRRVERVECERPDGQDGGGCRAVLGRDGARAMVSWPRPTGRQGGCGLR